ncbi:MAG: ribosome biogenesis GTPase Der [Candidatus Shikimatogenerans bostrichidophilus]|nr:MAG: ribosome biogenesis GTPase Der [Candidatus Shikimatogenerans bostrichidophilus]
MDYKIITIVGKTNVGKSTLFNFLIKKKKSTIKNSFNTTKNKNYGILNLKEKKYLLIDTGGFINENNNILYSKIKNQILISIKESHLILLVIDVIYGITNEDKELINIIKKYNKKVFLLINKIDINNNNNIIYNNYYNYYKLGIKKIYPISTTHNIGFKKLYKDINNTFNINNIQIQYINKKIKLSILGVPNTGKSTFINKFFNDNNKSIISKKSGTTIDTLYFYYYKNNNNLVLIDTPGIRKKFKFKKKKNFLLNTIKVIKESDICILIIDINNYITNNDYYIYKKILKYKKGLILIFNKCDLLKKNELLNFKKKINNINEFYNYPKLFLSLKYNFNKIIFNKINKLIKYIYYNKNKKIKTSFLNKKIYFLFKKINNKKKFKIKFCYQLKDKLFPSFLFIVNKIKKIKNNNIKYIEKEIINEFNFYGTSIEILFKKNNLNDRYKYNFKRKKKNNKIFKNKKIY